MEVVAAAEGAGAEEQVVAGAGQAEVVRGMEVQQEVGAAELHHPVVQALIPNQTRLRAYLAIARPIWLHCSRRLVAQDLVLEMTVMMASKALTFQRDLI